LGLKATLSLYEEEKMILLTRLNGTQFYINAEMIQTVEETPNTVISLVDHNKYIVKECAAVVAEKFLQYRQKLTQHIQAESNL
jgi:flagellar protein FlbD